MGKYISFRANEMVLIFNKILYKKMKKFLLIFFATILIFAGTISTKACDPARTPFNEILDQYNPKFNSAVEGYFISANTFKVTYSYDSSIKVGSERKVLEYGPFGSRCEMYEMESSADKTLIGPKNNRLLILYKDRSKNGKIVTPIFHGYGVSISVSNTVIFQEAIYSNQSSNWQEYFFSATLNTIRNRLTQKDATTPINWSRMLIKK